MRYCICVRKCLCSCLVEVEQVCNSASVRSSEIVIVSCVGIVESARIVPAKVRSTRLGRFTGICVGSVAYILLLINISRRVKAPDGVSSGRIRASVTSRTVGNCLCAGASTYILNSASMRYGTCTCVGNCVIVGASTCAVADDSICNCTSMLSGVRASARAGDGACASCTITAAIVNFAVRTICRGRRPSSG